MINEKLDMVTPYYLTLLGSPGSLLRSVVYTEVSAVLWVQVQVQVPVQVQARVQVQLLVQVQVLVQVLVQVQTPEVTCVNLHITSHSPIPPCEGFAGVE